MRPRSLSIAAALAAVLLAACGSGQSGSASDDASSAPTASASAAPTVEPSAPTADASGAASPQPSVPETAATSSTEAPTATAVSASPTRASATATGGSARGATGQVLTVSRVRDLDPAGVTLTVSGRDYDESIGVYVALCVIPAPGQVPTPCGGGVDMSGASGASAWVSSSAPAYGQSLAVPYRPGGDFTVRISVSARIGTIDCRTTACAIVTRADHLRTDDRSADVIVPVRFARP